MTLAQLLHAACQVIYDLRFNAPEEVKVLRDAMQKSMHMALGDLPRWN